MPAPTTSEFWNQTNPAAATGDQNIVIQSDGATPEQSLTAYPKRMVGDTGSGGKAGTVPPPGAGDAAAGKFLKSDATWAVPATDPNALIGRITIIFDGQGSVVATGTGKPDQIEPGGTLFAWSAVADQVGSFNMDICFHAGSAPPTGMSIPNTTTDKISASAPVSMSSAQSASGDATAISTWSKVLSQWGTVLPNLTSVTGCKYIKVILFYTKP